MEMTMVAQMRYSGIVALLNILVSASLPIFTLQQRRQI